MGLSHVCKTATNDMKVFTYFWRCQHVNFLVHSLILNVPSLWKGCLSACGSMLVVEFGWTSFEVKMGFLCRILKHERELFPRNNWHERPFMFIDRRNWEKQCTRKCHVLSQKFTFDPSNSLRKWAECLCDPLDGKSTSTSSHAKICNPQ